MPNWFMFLQMRNVCKKLFFTMNLGNAILGRNNWWKGVFWAALRYILSLFSLFTHTHEKRKRKKTETTLNLLNFCRGLFCPIVGCGARLTSLEGFEDHYNARHTASCSVCSRVYPTSRLLSIHVSEAHDSFFQAKVARGYAMVFLLSPIYENCCYHITFPFILLGCGLARLSFFSMILLDSLFLDK